LALALAALLCLAEGARGQETLSYSDRVKATLHHVLAGREFKPVTGCLRAEPCASLLARLRAGDFSVIEPIERSDRLDMPSYRRIRQKCSRLDPIHLRTAHRVTVATRNFAMYKLDVPKRFAGGDDVLVFRGQHYVPVGPNGVTAGKDSGPYSVWPGMFVAIGFPSCRQFSSATAQEGDRLARHNALSDDDYLSEIVKIANHFLVLNLDPIAGPNQEKAAWWYDLELWDWGPNADADLHRNRHVYAFSYRPVSVPLPQTNHAQAPLR
jgi:hypothetical protein